MLGDIVALIEALVTWALVGVFFLGIPVAVIRDKKRRIAEYEASVYARETGRSYRSVMNDDGARGEFLISKALENAFPRGKMLFNVYLPKYGGETTEVDIILITERVVYVIESKNYSGRIYGKQDDKNWTAVYNPRSRHVFYSPVKQNQGHIRWLSANLGISSAFMRSVVVFGDDSDIRNVECRGHADVVKRKQVVQAVLNVELSLLQAGAREPFGEGRADALYQRLKPFCHPTEALKAKHVQDVARIG